MSAAGSHEVRGRTLGIVGYGRIGSQVSVLAETLGMNVVYFDPARVLPMGNARGCESLGTLLESSDVVTIHVPLNDSTVNLIGKDEVSRMRSGAALINNSRGGVVDIDALAGALTSGQLSGAAVDVFPKEPASNDEPFESPLKGLDNVILTPHIGGSTEEAQRAIGEEVAAKLITLMNRGSTASAVNVPEVDLPVLHESNHRLLHYHHNVPGVLNKLHRITTDLNINISAEYLQSDMKHSYVIMDVEAGKGEDLKRRIKADIPETIRVRTVW